MAINLEKLAKFVDDAVAAINREMAARVKNETAAERKERIDALYKAKGCIGKIPLSIRAAQTKGVQNIALMTVAPDDHRRSKDPVCNPEQLVGAAQRVYGFCVSAGLSPLLRYTYTDTDFPGNGNFFELRTAWEVCDEYP